MKTMTETPTKLRQIRESMGLTQEALARRTRSINLRTYIRAESGKTGVKYNTAQEILDAINEIRADERLAPLALADLGLTIY